MKEKRMNLLMKPELTPTRIVRDHSEPQSTTPGKEADHVWSSPESVVEPGWTLDLPASESPPEDALLKVVMAFGDEVVRMEAIDVGIAVEGNKAPSVYGRLIDAVRMHIEASGERVELLRYGPDTWFRFVPPGPIRSRPLKTDFWPEVEEVDDFIAAATEGRYEEEDEPGS
jgi:hypothetical protein